MAHYKRRHRRKGGKKGCCCLCMLRKTDGRRNGRIPTWQEKRSKLSELEWVSELGNQVEGVTRRKPYLPKLRMRPSNRRMVRSALSWSGSHNW